MGIQEADWYIPALHLHFNDDLTVAWADNSQKIHSELDYSIAGHCKHRQHSFFEHVDVVVDEIRSVVVRFLDDAHHCEELVNTLQQKNMRVLFYVQFYDGLAGVLLVFLSLTFHCTFSGV